MLRNKSLFTYRALTPETSRIRLIRFQQDHSVGGASESPDLERLCIHCDIRHVTLETAPAYAALSYTWGSRLDSEIIINGKPLTVARNLAYALRSLRDRNEVDFIWVDALCIDQGNEVEKTEQVRQMQHIYAKAAHVVAWIGPNEHESDRAMRWIQHHGKAAHELGIGSKPELRFRALLREDTDDVNAADLQPAKALARDVVQQFTMVDPEHRATFLALSKLLDRAFWNRMWIVQEMTHGRALSFRCGDMVVGEEHFHHALRLLRNGLFVQELSGNVQARETVGAEVFSIETMNPVVLLKLRRAKQMFPLIYLLRHLQHFDASDPRDMVFAVLNCASDTRLQPDYRTPCESVFVETTLSMLKDGFFDILTLCDPRNHKRPLPSWVPDFTIKQKVNALQQRALTRQTRPMRTVLQPEFNACHGLRSTGVTMERIDNGLPILFLQAAFVSHVASVSSVWTDRAVGTWLNDFRQLLPQHLAHGSQQLESIVRTAVADQEIRHGNSKPRLSPALLQTVVDSLTTKKLDEITAADLTFPGAGDYVYQMTNVAIGRRPFLTPDGRLGLGPADTQPGDCVYILLGSTTPHVLRAVSPDAFSFVGEAYVHTIMDGEFMRDGGQAHVIKIT